MRKDQNGKDSLTTMVQVAHMYYDRNFSQQEIADQMGVSRSLIAHTLKKARQLGLVKIEILDPGESCQNLGNLIQDLTGLKRVNVVQGSGSSNMLTRRAVAGSVARYLESALKDGDVLGLGWGRTSMEVMNVMAPVSPRRMEVVPILGESGYGGMYSQVNQMVLQFTRFFGAKPHFLLAPMVVSTSSLRDALLQENSIRKAGECWQRLTHAFVGIGALPSVEGHVLYLGEEQVMKIIKAGGVGDITTRFFDNSGNFINIELHERVMGISMEHLRRVENVLAAACGAEKLQATLAALRTGLISHLFIDDELGNAMVDEFQGQGVGVVDGSGGR